MDRFIDREGIEMEGIEPIAISDSVKLKVRFEVVIFKDSSYQMGVNSDVANIEYFDSYPNKNQILWAIMKNKGQSAGVHKKYYIEDIPF